MKGINMSPGYKKLPNCTGIYKNHKTLMYLARKRVEGEEFNKTFSNLRDAKRWRHIFNGKEQDLINSTSSLKEVWIKMQESHFPTLATSTKSIWIRRYHLWLNIEHLPMDEITPTIITKWVVQTVEFYKSEYYQLSGRGNAGRCNLNNELNLFVTIFNWYKESEEFEQEARALTNPIKRKHRKLAFIKPLPEKIKQISLEDALIFFEYLKPLYRSLAMIQFFTAGRIGEVAGIQWENVDLERRRLIIKQTCVWDMTSKAFVELKLFPKNKESRACYLSDEMLTIFKEMKSLKQENCGYVFHVEGRPLNYGTIQINYKGAQRKGNLPYSGTHILRHGMAKLARKIGGLDAVMAMTGHKDVKLADHYSKCNEDDQKEASIEIFKRIREVKASTEIKEYNNVLQLTDFSKNA